MRILLLIHFLLITSVLYSQNSAGFDSTVKFCQEHEIRLNTVTPPTGFKVYYNCDSLLFMRGDFGDTIKIWTSAMDLYQSLREFSKTIRNDRYGETLFAKNIDQDGRIYVSTYHQTEFIYRNDSLYEIENANTPKLIFAKKMFQNKKKVKPSRKLNFEGDTLELERMWTENGKTCYVVRINNKTENTSYAYAIDQDMRFVIWEGCIGKPGL